MKRSKKMSDGVKDAYKALTDKKDVLSLADLSAIDEMNLNEYYAHISFFPDAFNKNQIGQEAYDYLNKGTEFEKEVINALQKNYKFETLGELKQLIKKQKISKEDIENIVKQGSLNYSFLNSIEQGYGTTYSKRFSTSKTMQINYFLEICEK